MKTIKYLLIILLLPHFAYAQMNYDVKFSRSDFVFGSKEAKNGKAYQKILTEHLVYSQEAGAPELPVKIVKLIVPTNSDVSNLTASFDIIEKKVLPTKIFPTQYNIPTSVNMPELQFVEPDPDIYESDKPFPEKVVELIHSGFLDNNNHIITLKVTPFQYFPKLDQLELLDNISIDLSFSANDHKTVLPNKRTYKTQEIWDNVLKAVVDNDEDIPRYQQKPKLSLEFEPNGNGLKKPTPCEFYEYTIITSSTLKSNFNSFITHKSNKGINIGVVTTASIYNEYTGDGNLTDNAGAVRAYLKDLYEQGGTWVLLAGDFSVVPIRYGCGWDLESWTRWVPDDYRIPADIYFADRNGNWNVDGDQWTGQPNDDNPDYFPELFLGRLLCTTGQEIDDWSTKIIRYERIGFFDPSYVVDCFMVESDEMQDNNEAEFVRNHLPSFTTTIWREQPASNAFNPTSPTGAQVLAEMNNDYGFYGWFGHGAPTTLTTMSRNYNAQPRWCLDAEDNWEAATAQEVENQDALDILTNFDMPAIIYSIGCDHTPFDNYHTDPNHYNMGESFTVNNTAGGPAFLGNTRYGWVWTSSQFFEEFADLIEAGNRHLGVAELISKANFNNHYIRYSHNLVGCPETEIYTEIPPIGKRTAGNIDEDDTMLPKEYKIIGNYPNPFNPSTTIKYALPVASNVELVIFDMLGKQIMSFNLFNQPAGYNEIEWDGKTDHGKLISSGIYFYRLSAISSKNVSTKFTGVSKMLLLK